MYLCADFTGLHCVVSNSLGEGSPCPAEVVLEVELSRLQQQELVIILVICGVTLALLLLLALATCYYCSRRHKQPDKGEQTSLAVLLKTSLHIHSKRHPSLSVILEQIESSSVSGSVLSRGCVRETRPHPQISSFLLLQGGKN